MTYTVDDLAESLQRVKLSAPVETVLCAWGKSEEGYGEWSGGFVLRLKNGEFAVLTGWCDTTGWGCQDGAEVSVYPSEKEALAEAPLLADENPADLNLWVEAGCPEDVFAWDRDNRDRKEPEVLP